jgi:CRISPR-associated protein Csb2
MAAYLCLSVTFLDPMFHGRRDGDQPEWPPSPLRLFQALVAAAAARWGERQRLDYAVPALQWLAERPPPMVVAPSGADGAAYRLSVPNNAMDILARAWSRGNDTGKGDANPATHRAMKTVRPTRLPDGGTASYLWDLPEPLTDDVRSHVEVLSAAARSLVALGWGVDLVAGDGRTVSAEEADRLPGERWRPVADPGANGLRVPRPDTLAALAGRHQAFLNRVTDGGLVPVPPLTAFGVVGYRWGAGPARRPFAAFQLLKPNAGGFRPFDPVRRTHVVAGMVRHATARAANSAGRPADWTASYVLGHGDGPSTQARADARFAYLPLPTVNPRKVESIRRVLIAEPPGGAGHDARWAMRAVSGAELVHDGTPVGLLSLTAHTERVVQRYVAPATTWCSVTPVVLPGHDGASPKDLQSRQQRATTPEARQAVAARAEERTLRLLRRALVQAGFAPELSDSCDLEWRQAGYLAGVESAGRYAVPPYLGRLPRYHVRITWRSAAGHPIRIPGPIAVGAGRYCGLGLFAAWE